MESKFVKDTVPAGVYVSAERAATESSRAGEERRPWWRRFFGF